MSRVGLVVVVAVLVVVAVFVARPWESGREAGLVAPESAVETGTRTKLEGAVPSEVGSAASTSVPERTLTILVVDESGKGVPGALMKVATHAQLVDVRSRDAFNALVSGVGFEFRSDEDGRIVLPVIREMRKLVVRAEGLVSDIVGLRDGLSGEHEVVLHPLREVLLELRDDEGRPVVGYPVRWSREDLPPSPWFDDLRRFSTDVEGRSCLPIPIKSAELAGARVILERDGVVRKPEILRFGVEDWPSEVVPVRIRPFGSVIVEVGADFKPAAWGSSAVLAPTATDFFWGEKPPRRVKIVQGRARFDFIELNADPAVMAIGETKPQTRASGPTEPGETLVIHLGAEARAATVEIRARLVDPGGRPLSGLVLQTARATTGDLTHESRERLSCAPGGIWRLAFPWQEGTSLSITLEQRHAGHAPTRVEIPGRIYAAGETDLGDLVLEPLPVIASGRVLDHEGQALAGALVEILTDGEPEPAEATVVLDLDGDALRVEGGDGVITDDQGRFTLHGEMPRASFQVRAGKKGKGNTTREVQPGDSGIELRLTALAELRGVIRPGGDLRLEQLVAKLWNAEGEAVTGARPDEQGRLHLRRAPGVYRLTVSADHDPTMILFEKKGVELVAGEVLDLGEIPIDLEIRSVAILLENAQLLRQDAVSYLVCYDENGREIGERLINRLTKKVTFKVSSRPIFVEVQAAGLKRERRRVDTETATIALEAGIEVEVALVVDGPSFPHARVRVCLFERSGERLIIATQDAVDHRQTAGRIRVSDAGPYEVGVLVAIPTQSGDMEDIVQTGVLPSSFEVGPQGGKLEVRCPAASIEAKVKELARLSSR